ncbi:hypothetical protein LTR78_002346 [Recurvomyces mirabilis]|uniref:Uncharacterized protein n=1 Tax=Recurvomyces mirabilis TaxID=574656 RepID=A0AAE0WSW9_9PEZI|nr:hypothetical protein LTR78_002346 [Recurvomyces mirabilis]KAK5157275.1 hypothetical protein LTS14_004040 [Recurvomyces mirabilis]
MLSTLLSAGPISAILGNNVSSSSSARRASSANSQSTSCNSREVSPSTASSGSHSTQPMTIMTTTELAAQWLQSPLSPTERDTPALLDRKYLKAHVLAIANLIPKSAAPAYTAAERKDWSTISNNLCALITKQHNALLPTKGLSRDLKLMLADDLEVSSFAVDESVFFTLSHSHGGDKNGRSADLDTLLSYVVYAASQLFIEREGTKLALCKQRLARRAAL